MAATSPLVRALHWGRVDTDAGSFRDAKLWPSGGRGWDWNETGTSHAPGIQPADVVELLDHGATIVLLSQGLACPGRQDHGEGPVAGQRACRAHLAED